VIWYLLLAIWLIHVALDNGRSPIRFGNYGYTELNLRLIWQDCLENEKSVLFQVPGVLFTNMDVWLLNVCFRVDALEFPILPSCLVCKDFLLQLSSKQIADFRPVEYSPRRLMSRVAYRLETPIVVVICLVSSELLLGLDGLFFYWKCLTVLFLSSRLMNPTAVTLRLSYKRQPALDPLLKKYWFVTLVELTRRKGNSRIRLVGAQAWRLLHPVVPLYICASARIGRIEECPQWSSVFLFFVCYSARVFRIKCYVPSLLELDRRLHSFLVDK